MHKHWKTRLTAAVLAAAMLTALPITAEAAQSINPYLRNEAEALTASENVVIGDTAAGGVAVGYIENGSYIAVSNVDFGDGADSFAAGIASAGSGGTIELHLDSRNGVLIGSCAVPVTGGWDTWKTASCAVSGAAGVHDLYLVFTGGEGYLFNVDWWQFHAGNAVIPGDVNADGVIDGADLTLAKRGVLYGFQDAKAESAADVDGSGTVDTADLAAIQKYLLGQITAFERVVLPTEPEREALSMEEFTAQCAAALTEYEPEVSRAELPGTQYGTVQSGSYYSTTCRRVKPYNILLPAGYDENKQYPVLYVMHGYWENQDRMILQGNGTMYTRQIIGNAIAEGAAKDMIVVFPYIYSSDSQDNCSGMDDFNNAAYDNFINDLTRDLMPHIEQTYSVKTGRENTAITGFSMGGREALLIGMQRPDLFGYVGAICPAPGVTGAFKWESGTEPYLLMITGGSNDTVVYGNPENYHKQFAQNGVPHIWHYVNGGYHGDNSIHAHLYNFCRFVFQAAE